MKLLDRYIAAQYATNVVVLFVILFSFVVAIDVSINIDRFWDNAAELIARDSESGAEPGPTRTLVVSAMLVFDLWWPRLLNLYNTLLGVVLIAGMGFTGFQMVRHRELVAILASGQSLFRVARPALAVALGFAMLQVLNQELIIPRIAPLLLRDHGQAGTRDLGSTDIPLTPDSAGRLLLAEGFDPAPAQGPPTLRGITIIKRDSQGRMTATHEGDTATWTGTAWRFDPPASTTLYGETRRPGEPLTEFVTTLDPSALRVRSFDGYRQSLSWSQTGRMIRLVRDNAPDGPLSPETRRRLAELERTRFGRISAVLSSMLALVITMPFFITRLPTNTPLQALKCAPIALLALIAAAAGPSISIPGLPAAVGVFIPVLILAPAAVATVTSVRT
ncbi:MAG: LptF/LptG family permease [Planctomycetota bacterium]